jgi:hypothetical protein
MKNRIFTQDEIQDLLEDVINLIDDLSFDYDRLSQCGKQTYDELCNKLNIG